MHGRPRKPLTPEQEKKYAKEAALLLSLQSDFLQYHHNKEYSKDKLDKNAELVTQNPEYMTAWNFRKLAAEHILNDPERKEEIDATLKEELKVAESALRKNPKSYGAWYHRKWVLRKIDSYVDKELELLDKFLSLDSRNFHMWNHRRFVTGLKKRSDEDELKYTEKVIGANFSNYSAWHNRSVLLSKLFGKKTEGFSPKENKLAEEFDFVHGAIFTDPDDQSGWFYHLWLLYEMIIWPRQHSNRPVSLNDGSESRIRDMISWDDHNFNHCKISLPHEEGENETSDQLKKDREEILKNEIDCFQELLLEENCKIGKLTLARLFNAQNAISPNAMDESVYSNIIDLYNDLTSLDVPHVRYYEDQRSLVKLQQLTSSLESLLIYCYQYRFSKTAGVDNYICLRLNNLSLSRVGSCERLLWVQMLDLSHNQLSSIEGIEAMQLLLCLNLSHNKIHSFSALEPLKLLRSLNVLNISNNEIGLHSVDTTRYLCSSPFSHTVTSDWNLSEFVNTEDFDLANKYWGAFSIFRDLKLIQLDIIGNVVVNDEFKSFLVKIIPTLKWLDGNEI